MAKDIYYYELKRPLYAVMEEFNIVRVLAIKYQDEKPVSYLTDWGAAYGEPSWYGQKHWLDNEVYGAYPFNATFERSGEICLGDNPISMFELMCERHSYYTSERIREKILNELKRLQVPHFDTEDEADMYHFKPIQ